MATRIRTRNDLINWLENNAPRRAIARAIQEGQVENLGAFEEVAPDFQPGWIVKVTSIHKTIWFVVIHIWHREFKSFIRNDVPWEKWIGEFANNKLYQGDNSLQYKELRDEKSTESNN